MSQANQSEINDVAWRACDTFRGVVDAENYRNYILVMLFRKYVSDVWRDHRDAYLPRNTTATRRASSRRLARERFQLPGRLRFLQPLRPAQRDRHRRADQCRPRPASRRPTRRSSKASSARSISTPRPSSARPRTAIAELKHLLEDFAEPRLDLRPSRVGEEDIIGNVYEYLIERFASDAGKKAGEFYTPGQVSKLLAMLLASEEGRHHLRSRLRLRLAADQGRPAGGRAGLRALRPGNATAPPRRSAA